VICIILKMLDVKKSVMTNKHQWNSLLTTIQEELINVLQVVMKIIYS